MKIGFGAIGKGYAAERVKKLMLSKGVLSGVINASGDLTTWGRRVNGETWNIGIPNPENKDEIILWLPLDEKAIATSGDYEKYFTSDGKRYSHIINPVTGIPVVGSRSVSVVSDNAELSDALATAVAVMGLDVCLNLINQLSGVECIFIDNNGKLHFSNGLKPYEN
jgi:thiamine biosynthesis lipoprotein